MYKGEKIEIENGELHLPYELKRFDEIEGLDSLSNLKELYLSHNNITEIKGLGNLNNLELLYLDANNITEIKGLDNLSKLKVLEISNNGPFTPNSILESMRNYRIKIYF